MYELALMNIFGDGFLRLLRNSIHHQIYHLLDISI